MSQGTDLMRWVSVMSGAGETHHHHHHHHHAGPNPNAFAGTNNVNASLYGMDSRSWNGEVSH